MPLPDILGLTGAEGGSAGDAIFIGGVSQDTTTVAGNWSLGSWRCDMSQAATVVTPYLVSIAGSGAGAELGGGNIPLGYQRAYSANWRFHFDSAETTQFGVIEDRDNASINIRLVMRRIANQAQLILTDRNGVQLSGASKLLDPDTWYRLNAVVSPTTLTSYYLWIDGELQLTAFAFPAFTGLTGDIQFGDISKGSIHRTYWFDDVIVTARWIVPPAIAAVFDGRVRRLLPSGSVSGQDNWALGAIPPPPPATSWGALQSNDGDASYVQSNTPGETVLNELGDVPAGSSAQYIRHFLVAEGLDAPVQTSNLVSVLRLSASDRTLASPLVGSTYREVGYVHGLAPDGTPWDDPKVGAARAGARIAAGAQRFRVTQQGLTTAEMRSGPPSIPKGSVSVI